MRQTRGFKLSTKTSAFLVFALAAISLLVTTMSPRAVSAEAPLLNTVRCLVRTVLLSDCKSVSPQTPTAPAPQAAESTPPAAQPPATPATSMQSPVANRTYTAAEDGIVAPEPIALPSGEVSVPTGTLAATKNLGSGRGVSQSEYVAYFNTFSPYAVAGAQQQAEAAVPLRQSTEGWKIFGTPWYAWGAVLVVAILILPSVRKGILRNISALSKNP